MSLRQSNLFAQTTICDYLFDKDKIFAYLNLDDNELFIYSGCTTCCARTCRRRISSCYLQAPTEVLERRAAPRPHARPERRAPRARPRPDYVKELNEAYQHFFFHYTATPLLVVETSGRGPRGDHALDDLLRQMATMSRGTRYYVPRPGRWRVGQVAGGAVR
jgi:deoxyadenosine/deoxycytidine kinase